MNLSERKAYSKKISAVLVTLGIEDKIQMQQIGIRRVFNPMDPAKPIELPVYKANNVHRNVLKKVRALPRAEIEAFLAQNGRPAQVVGDGQA